MNRTKEQTSICYLTVYEVNRCYGGPEEGGWWYEAYDMKACVPFEAHLVLEDRAVDVDDPNDRRLFDEGGWDEDGEFHVWHARSIEPTDRGAFGQGQAWLSLEMRRLEELYEIDGQHGPLSWYQVVREWRPGERNNWTRPRYQ